MKKIGKLPCFGVCNVGMLSNIAVIKNGKSSDRYIESNSCKVKCAGKALKREEILVNEEEVITGRYGIEKPKTLEVKKS